MTIELTEKQADTLKSLLEYITAFIRTANYLIDLKQALNKKDTEEIISKLD